MCRWYEDGITGCDHVRTGEFLTAVANQNISIEFRDFLKVEKIKRLVSKRQIDIEIQRL